MVQCGEIWGLFRFIIMTKNSQSAGKIERHVEVSLNMCMFILDIALWVIGGAEPAQRENTEQDRTLPGQVVQSHLAFDI